MKKTILLLSMTVLMNQGFAQTPAEVLKVDHGVIAEALDKEADSGAHEKKASRLLKKVSGELKKLEDCVPCKEKTKAGIVIRNVGRKLGKGSSWVTTATSKPFLNASGFLTGTFEKREKNQNVVGLYKLFLSHSEEFDKLYLEAETPLDFAGLLGGKVNEIIALKLAPIMKDIEENHPELKLEGNQQKLADFINGHDGYQELKPAIGEITLEGARDISLIGEINKDISFETLVAAAPKIHEGIGTMVGQLFGPKIVLGVVSSTLAGLYSTPVAFADIGTAISSAICVHDQFLSETPKYKEDKDLAEFCSYVVNRSAYELIKSRARGYVAGKKFRAKIDQRLN